MQRSVPFCLRYEGTKTGQISDLSNQRAVCPDAPFRSRLHPSLTKVILCPFSCKKASSSFFRCSARGASVLPGQSITKLLEIGYSDASGQNCRNFFQFFLMANLIPVLPSFLLGLVQHGAFPLAARFAVSFLPRLDNRRLCHVLNLTRLGVAVVSPNAIFPGRPLYIRFAVRVQSELPHRLLKSVGKSSLFCV